MENKKNTLAQDLSLIRRGFSLLVDVLGKATFILNIIHCFLSVAMNYIGIYFSAQIVNELAGNRDKERVLLYVCLTLGSTLVLSLIINVLSKITLTLESEEWSRFLYLLSKKTMGMDFPDVESDYIKQLYAEIMQAYRSGGWGFFYIFRRYQKVIQEISKIICSVALALSLFILPVPQENTQFLFLNSPLTLLTMLILFALITWFLSHITVLGSSLWQKAMEGNLQFVNRIFSFYMYDLPSENQRNADARMYCQERFLSPALDILQKTEADIWREGRRKQYHYLSISEAVLQVFTGLIYIYVCLKALGGAFGLGNIAQYVAAVTGLSVGIRGLISLIGELRINNIYMEKIFEYLDFPNNMYQGTLPVEKRNDREYTMEFRNVSFKYPGTDIYALRNVNLKFKIGQRLAVVGMNGSGKTTFIKLMCRLYDPTEGEILMNGVDIRKYDYKEYMDIFSIVFQDFKIFSFTLGQNVAASMEYDKERAEKCLIEAGFGDRLASMPHGVDTYMYRDFEKDGVQISGGEAQKVALARALYKNAPFIILDEPTAALDPIAEYEIYSKFNEMVEDKTAIYISHRLSSCRFCDSIAVFDQGHIVQTGTHEELVADTKGKYYELWSAQAQYYTETA